MQNYASFIAVFMVAAFAVTGFGYPLEDGVITPFELTDKTKVSALWFDLSDLTFRIHWNPSSKSAVLTFPDNPKPQQYQKYPVAIRRRIDEAVAFAGHGPNTIAVAGRHSFRNPLEIKVQLVVGLAEDGATLVVPVSSLSNDGREALASAWNQIGENYARNEPLRQLKRTQRAAERAQDAAEEARDEANRARRASEAAARETQTTTDTLRGLGFIP